MGFWNNYRHNKPQPISYNFKNNFVKRIAQTNRLIINYCSGLVFLWNKRNKNMIKSKNISPDQKANKVALVIDSPMMCQCFWKNTSDIPFGPVLCELSIQRNPYSAHHSFARSHGSLNRRETPYCHFVQMLKKGIWSNLQ